MKKKNEKRDYSIKQFIEKKFFHPDVLAPHELAFTLLSGLHDVDAEVLTTEHPSQAISELNSLLQEAYKLEKGLKWRRKWKKRIRMDKAISSFQMSESEKYEVRNWV